MRSHNAEWWAAWLELGEKHCLWLGRCCLRLFLGRCRQTSTCPRQGTNDSQSSNSTKVQIGDSSGLLELFTVHGWGTVYRPCMPQRQLLYAEPATTTWADSQKLLLQSSLLDLQAAWWCVEGGVGEDVSYNQCPCSESLLSLVIICCFCNLEEELCESPKFLLSSPYQVCFLSGSHELQFRGNCCMTEDTQYINKWLFSNIKLKHKICVVWVSSVIYSWLLLVIRKTNCFLL